MNWQYLPGDAGSCHSKVKFQRSRVGLIPKGFREVRKPIRTDLLSYALWGEPQSRIHTGKLQGGHSVRWLALASFSLSIKYQAVTRSLLRFLPL